MIFHCSSQGITAIIVARPGFPVSRFPGYPGFPVYPGYRCMSRFPFPYVWLWPLHRGGAELSMLDFRHDSFLRFGSS
jgi:hypothetical protein